MKTQIQRHLRSVIMLTVVAIAVAGCQCGAPGEKGGWTALFDGKTINGWAVKGGVATYRVEDSAIVGKTTEGSANTFLCTEKDYGDFEFECDVLCDPELNSGFQIRSHVYAKESQDAKKKARSPGTVYGYQCEIMTTGADAGNFWDEARRTKWLDDFASKPEARAAFKNKEWNHYRIVAQGDRIRSWVNGVPCADFRDSTDAKGFIGLQVHGIKAGAGPYQVRWKNIRIRELKPGETL